MAQPRRVLQDAGDERHADKLGQARGLRPAAADPLPPSHIQIHNRPAGV
jgi:hypothetical protein